MAVYRGFGAIEVVAARKPESCRGGGTHIRPGLVQSGPSKFFLTLHVQYALTSLRDVTHFVESRATREVLLGVLSLKAMVEQMQDVVETAKARPSGHVPGSLADVKTVCVAGEADAAEQAKRWLKNKGYEVLDSECDAKLKIQKPRSLPSPAMSGWRISLVPAGGGTDILFNADNRDLGAALKSLDKALQKARSRSQ